MTRGQLEQLGRKTKSTGPVGGKTHVKNQKISNTGGGGSRGSRCTLEPKKKKARGRKKSMDRFLRSGGKEGKGTCISSGRTELRNEGVNSETPVAIGEEMSTHRDGRRLKGEIVCMYQ